MPNWCDTTYKCVGLPKEVGELNAILERMNKREKPVIPNGFGKLWLGELVTELGFDYEKYRCRGEITDYNYDGGDTITICQYTAWYEQEGVRHAIEERFPSVKVFYLEEEPGCEVYGTNDSLGEHFTDNFVFQDDDETEYFETVEQAARYLLGKYGIKPRVMNPKAIAKAIDLHSEEHDIWMSFHEITRYE